LKPARPAESKRGVLTGQRQGRRAPDRKSIHDEVDMSFDAAASTGVNDMAARRGLEAAGLKAGETGLLMGPCLRPSNSERSRPMTMDRDRRRPLILNPSNLILSSSKDLLSAICLAVLAAAIGLAISFSLYGGLSLGDWLAIADRPVMDQ
jgi:hypothetical protein